MLKFTDVAKIDTVTNTAKNAALYSILYAFAKKRHSENQFDFVMSKDGNQNLYSKFLDENSSRHINWIPSASQGLFNKLAKANDWVNPDWKKHIEKTRDIVNARTIKDTIAYTGGMKIEDFQPFMDYVRKKMPEKLVDSGMSDLQKKFNSQINVIEDEIKKTLKDFEPIVEKVNYLKKIRSNQFTLKKLKEQEALAAKKNEENAKATLKSTPTSTNKTDYKNSVDLLKSANSALKISEDALNKIEAALKKEIGSQDKILSNYKKLCIKAAELSKKMNMAPAWEKQAKYYDSLFNI